MRGARIAFGDRVVASDLALEFPAGQTTCLLGRSGVGKTSLLRWLAGLLPGTGRVQPLAGSRGRMSASRWCSSM